MKRTQISERLRQAILQARLNGKPQYRIAHVGPVHPVTLSDWLRGARDVEVGDERVIAIGRSLNIAAEDCFAVPVDSDRGQS